MTELLFCVVVFFILMSFTYHMHICTCSLKKLDKAAKKVPGNAMIRWQLLKIRFK